MPRPRHAAIRIAIIVGVGFLALASFVPLWYPWLRVQSLHWNAHQIELGDSRERVEEVMGQPDNVTGWDIHSPVGPKPHVRLQWLGDKPDYVPYGLRGEILNADVTIWIDGKDRVTRVDIT